MSPSRESPLRIAFLTSEHAVEHEAAGGLASYVKRISETLNELGHHAEVFTFADGDETAAAAGNVLIHGTRVPGARAGSWAGRFAPSRSLTGSWLRGARAMARRLAARDSDAPFDIVHSTNCSAVGLFVPRMARRRHVVRASSLRELWLREDRVRLGWDVRAACWLERAAMRRADVVIAPSAWLAARLRVVLARDVAVVRPPAVLEADTSKTGLANLPLRYLVHFGQLGPRKGTDLLAHALLRAWQDDESLRMVWLGKEVSPGMLASWQRLWGHHADKVVVLAPRPKSTLYAIVRGAVATMVPSRADNLPNSAIESLLLGVPVIGTTDSSLEELVHSAHSGTLVPQDDADALAAAMIEAWRGEAAWQRSSFERPPILESMAPALAAHALLVAARGAAAPTGREALAGETP